MKTKLFILIISLVLVSCVSGTNRNYRTISRILQYPDSLITFRNDTIVFSNSFLDSGYYNYKYLIRLSNHIKEYFNNGYTVKKDYISEYHVTTDVYNSTETYFCDIHVLLLASKIDTSKELYLTFTNECDKRKWKIKDIFTSDPFEQREYLEIEHKKR